jgi:hypothetical protein
MMDVVILAGGFGTRLKDIWDGPKCLVPIKGKPLLAHLLQAVSLLQPRLTVLALGHRAAEVVAWLDEQDEQEQPLPVIFAIEDQPLGTAEALRGVMSRSNFGLTAPLLVLNGDTLPLYDLAGLIGFHYGPTAVWQLEDCDTSVAWCADRFAGAAVIGSRTLAQIERSTITSLDWFLLKAIRYRVQGFLDVGTPEGFRKAQEL